MSNILIKSFVVFVLFYIILWISYVFSKKIFIKKYGKCLYSGHTNFNIIKKVVHHSHGEEQSKIDYYLFLQRSDYNLDINKVRVSRDYFYSVQIGDNISTREDIFILNDKYGRFIYIDSKNIPDVQYYKAENFKLNKENILNKCIEQNKKDSVSINIALLLSVLIIAVALMWISPYILYT